MPCSSYTLQETQWEPPANGYLPIPLQWLPSPDQTEVNQPTSPTEVADQQQTHALLTPAAKMVPLTAAQAPSDEHQLISVAVVQAEAGGQQQKQAASTAHSLLQQDGALSQQVSAAHLSPAQPETDSQQADGERDACYHNDHSRSSEQQLGRRAVAARPESSGLMTSIPEPQGTHLRFDSDTEAQQRCADELLCQAQLGTQPMHQTHTSSPASIANLYHSVQGELQCEATAEPLMLQSDTSHALPATARQSDCSCTHSPTSTAGDQRSDTDQQAGIKSITQHSGSSQLHDAPAENF